MQKKLHEECQAMISGFVRQNSSALVEAIAVREHTEFVEHTVEERLIYRQACHDHGVFDLEAARCETTRRSLVYMQSPPGSSLLVLVSITIK